MAAEDEIRRLYRMLQQRPDIMPIWPSVSTTNEAARASIGVRSPLIASDGQNRKLTVAGKSRRPIRKSLN
jgi:hypothetical protein